jgi:hypothetical protein
LVTRTIASAAATHLVKDAWAFFVLPHFAEPGRVRVPLRSRHNRPKLLVLAWRLLPESPESGTFVFALSGEPVILQPLLGGGGRPLHAIK